MLQSIATAEAQVPADDRRKCLSYSLQKYIASPLKEGKRVHIFHAVAGFVVW
jgi:hypothetical protein